MDFSWSASDMDRYARIIAFAKQHLNADVDQREAEHRFPRQEWRACGEFGLQGLSIPEAYGGMGLDVLRTAHAVEAFGRGCEDMGLVFSACAHLFACAMPICEFGSEALKRQVLPGLCSGTLIGANAITEAGAGSDVHGLKAQARRDGDYYILNGAKSYVTNGAVADHFLVYAVSNANHGYLGISAFLLPRDTVGLQVGKPFDKVGLNTAQTGSLYLEEARVPATCLVGSEGQGAVIFASSMHWERACLFASYVGSMERTLERCIAYAKERQQFGKPIGSFQAISHRIADMKIRLESARLLLYRACWLRDQGQEATLDIGMAKTAVSEAAVQLGLDAVQIFGGSGVMREMGIEKALRDALPATIFSGTSDIQRNLIARELGL